VEPIVDYRQLLRANWERRHGARSRRTGHRADADGRPADAAAGVRLGPAQRLRRRLFERFLQDLEMRGTATVDRQQTRQRVAGLLDRMLSEKDAATLGPGERARLEEEVIAEVVGFGPLEPLFADPSVSDVLVNGPHEVWVDRFGRLEATAVRFDDQDHLLRLLGRVVDGHGRHLDEASPMVDIRLQDGSRLHALIPPICPVPVVSIRRQRPIPFRLGELYACDTLSPAMGELLSAAVRCGLNVLVSGGTGSGKTTLLNVLGGFIPPQERVITIEETVELHFDHPHVVHLEARLPNIEGRGEVSLRTLVKNSLRMRPDRIIVGEVRGAEVFDMLQAMNTGHDGSLTTVHANSPGDALRRLESLVLMGGFELPSRAIRDLLGAAFDVIVQLNRFLDGTRRVTSIGEVANEDDQLTTRELFRFETDGGGGAGGAYVATGNLPTWLPRLVAVGLDAGVLGTRPEPRET
jgi:pilus assembly protein CpaF